MVKIPLLDDFEGLWHLDRQIEDRKTGQSGQLIGRAEFSPDGDGLRYEEAGRLSYGDQPEMEATRSYLWRATEGGIKVLYEDGRPFHQIELDRLMPDAMHHCAPDLYYVSYDFAGWPRWRSTWRVVGPRKDYRMISEFTKGP